MRFGALPVRRRHLAEGGLGGLGDVGDAHHRQHQHPGRQRESPVEVHDAITVDSIGKTINGAKFAGRGNDLVLATSSFYKPTQAGAYPIVLATYEIVCSKYPDAATGTAVKAFMQAAIGPGQAGLDQYGSIPLPGPFQAKLAKAVSAIS